MRLGLNYNYSDSANARSVRRRRRVAGKLQAVCTHILDVEPIEDENGRPAVHIHFAFETFYGTFSYFCTRCGAEFTERTATYYRTHMTRAAASDFAGTVKNLMRRQRKEQKLARRLTRLGGLPPND